MKHERAACVCAILAVTMLAGGCGAKRTTDEDEKGEFTTLQQETAAEQEETTGSLPEIRQEDLQTYSNTVVTWGPGIQMAEDGRPAACIAFQEKYASLGVDFLKENKKVIYLTFDEGYENGYTEKILDILKEKQVSAVFFVTMPYAREQTALMNRFVQEGHVIGNHSVTHPSQGMPSLSIEDQMSEYQEMQDFIKNTYQYDMYLFRPPAGIFSEQSLAAAACFGYRTVLWSFAYADWDPDRQPSTEEALKRWKEGCIMGQFICYMQFLRPIRRFSVNLLIMPGNRDMNL